MKTLKIMALGLALIAANVTEARSAKEMFHLVLRTDKLMNNDKFGLKSGKKITKPTPDYPEDADDPEEIPYEATQADFMVLAALASLGSNTMLSKNNSALRAFCAVISALHGSAMACEQFHSTSTDSVLIIPLVFANKILPKSLNIASKNLNKIVATMLYLSGQNAVQIADYFKQSWSKGFIKTFIRLFTKNRDNSEIAAILVRNLLPLILLTDQGEAKYATIKNYVMPPDAPAVA